MKRGALAVLAVLAGWVLLGSAAGQVNDVRLRDLGRGVVRMVAKGDVRRLYSNFNVPMTTAVSFASIDTIVKDTIAADSIGRRVSETTDASQGFYAAEHVWNNQRVRFEIRFDDAEKIGGLFVRHVGQPSGGDPYKGYRTKVRLRLPFEGEWWVFWGGLKAEQNYHVKAPDQRYAYDIVIRRNGSTHAGKGDRNEDYYCYGKPILAPADGIVVGIKDGVPDNIPGVMNPSEAPGNYVAVDFGYREFGMFAHLIPGSLRVKPADKVKAGQILGHCGNSGNSSEPHLHFHLQDSGRWYGGARGKPAPFSNFLRNGKRTKRAIPVRGDFVTP